MISPEEIFWEAQYRCPFCEYPYFVNKAQMLNPAFKEIFCGCGKSYKVEKPKFKFVNDVGEAKGAASNIGAGFGKEIAAVMKSQGYNAGEIKEAIRMSSVENVTNIQDLFTKVIPRI